MSRDFSPCNVVIARFASFFWTPCVSFQYDCSNKMASHVDGNAVLQGTPATSSAFTPAQVEHYLRHISFPLPPTHPRDAFFLETLHRCQITSIPYENLSLHYNPAHSNSIDPQHLYAKFLPDFARALPERTDNSSRGRGGFCFETCVFFLYILRGLGFAAYPTAAHIRIRDHFTRVPSGPFVGPRHGEFSPRYLLSSNGMLSCGA